MSARIVLQTGSKRSTKSQAAKSIVQVRPRVLLTCPVDHVFHRVIFLAALLVPLQVGSVVAQQETSQSMRPEEVQPANSRAFCPVDRVLSVAWMESGLMAHSAAKPKNPSPGSFLPRASVAGSGVSSPATVFRSNPGLGDAEEVELQGLFGDGTRLEGEYVRVGSDRLDGPGVAASGGGINGTDFRFTADTTNAVMCIVDLSECPQFDAVNVYWHVDRFVREFWIDWLGVDIDFQAEARVHVAGDGGFADWPNRVMKLGVGDIFMKNSALSEDLIYHEYAHLAISSQGFTSPVGSSEQTRALHEAYADYFTATYTNDERIGDWLVTCPPRQQCVGPANTTDLRTLNLDFEAWVWNDGSPSDSLKYGVCTRFHEGDLKCKMSWNNFTNPYVWGMIWGAALWDMRTALGPDQADRIALGAVRLHSATGDFRSALADVLETASALYGPNVAGMVEQIFVARGIYVLSVDAERSEQPGESLAIDLWPNPVGQTLNLRWDKDAFQLPAGAQGSSRWQIVDALGRTVLASSVMESSVGAAERIALDVSSLKNGWYGVELEFGGRLVRASFLVQH